MSRQTLETTSTITIVADWPTTITSIGQDGTVTIDLPFSSNPSQYNRPTALTAIFVPSPVPASLTVAQALAQYPNASVDVSPQAALQTTDSIYSVVVSGVTPGTYTVWVVGTFAS